MPSLLSTHPDQIVCSSGEEKLPVYARPAAMMKLSQSADGFHPAEDFLDALPRALTQVVAAVPRRASVERVALGLAGDVRRRIELPQRLDEAACVIAFVGSDGYTTSGQTGDQADGGVALTGSGRRHHARVDDEPVAILHEHFAQVGELRLVPLGVLNNRLSGSVVD